MSHDHKNCSHTPKKNAVALKWAAAFTLIICFAEFLGGLFSNSLSLLSDAGHMFTDFFSIVLILVAMNWSKKPASHTKTYGYYRAEILAALINGALLLFIAIEVIQNAVSRFQNPQTVLINFMLPVSIIGLLANFFSAFLLHGHHTHLATRSAYYHILGDLISSIGVILAGIVIYFTHWYAIDSIVSIFIAIILVFGAYQIIRESVDILMEGAPAHISISNVREFILNTPDIKNIHDLHVWSISSELLAASAHLLLQPMHIEKSEKIVEQLSQKLKIQFGISHTTFQVETIDSKADEIRCN